MHDHNFTNPGSPQRTHPAASRKGLPPTEPPAASQAAVFSSQSDKKEPTLQEKLRAELLQKQMLQLNQMKLHFSKKNADRGSSSSPSSPSLGAMQQLPASLGRIDISGYNVHSPQMPARDNANFSDASNLSPRHLPTFVNISPGYSTAGYRPYPSSTNTPTSSSLMMKRKEPSFLGIHKFILLENLQKRVKEPTSPVLDSPLPRVVHAPIKNEKPHATFHKKPAAPIMKPPLPQSALATPRPSQPSIADGISPPLSGRQPQGYLYHSPINLVNGTGHAAADHAQVASSPRPLDKLVRSKISISRLPLGQIVPWSVSMSPETFQASLISFCRAANIFLCKPPVYQQQRVHFYDLYHLVLRFGGYLLVTEQDKWRLVCNTLKISPSFHESIQRFYLLCLYPYEQFFGIKKNADFIEVFQEQIIEPSVPLSRESSDSETAIQEKISGIPVSQLLELSKQTFNERKMPFLISAILKFAEIECCLASNLEIETRIALCSLVFFSRKGDAYSISQVQSVCNILYQMVHNYLQKNVKKSAAAAVIDQILLCDQKEIVPWTIKELSTIRKDLSFSSNLALISLILRNFSSFSHWHSSMRNGPIVPVLLALFQSGQPELVIDSINIFTNLMDNLLLENDQISIYFQEIFNFFNNFHFPFSGFICSLEPFQMAEEARKDSAEYIKKTILHQMNWINSCCKQLHPLVYLLLESITKFIAKEENRLKLYEAFQDKRHLVLGCVSKIFLLILPCLNAVSFILEAVCCLLQEADLRSLEQTNSWLALMNGNPNFGWPDYGLMEMALAAMAGLRNSVELSECIGESGLDGTCAMIETKEMMKSLLHLAGKSKNLWKKGIPVNTAAWKKSFIIAPSSSPYSLMRKSLIIVQDAVTKDANLKIILEYDHSFRHKIEETLLEISTDLSKSCPNVFGQDEILEICMKILEKLP